MQRFYHPFSGRAPFFEPMPTAGKTTYETYSPAGLGEGRLPLVENQNVLEVGFGAGDLLRALIARGNTVCGVDAGRDIVEGARREGLGEVFLLDVSEENLPFNENAFDAVYCYETFEHLTNPYRLFVEVRRVLKPGGRLFFTVPSQESTMGYGPSRHAFVYPGLLEKKNLERFFMQMHFKVEHSEEDPPTLIVHRHYILSNQKGEGLLDIMDVIIGDYSVVDLYRKVLPPTALKEEIETELGPYLDQFKRSLAAGDAGPAEEILHVLAIYYPDYPPLYLQAAELLWRHGLKTAARQVLEQMRNQCRLPDNAFEKAAALIERLDQGAEHPPR